MNMRLLSTRKHKLAGLMLLGLLPLGLLAKGWAESSTIASSDVLNRPAVMSPLAPKSLINGLTQAGKRLVAVGQRGHVLISDDQGASWTQVRVPVSSDLVAVYFPQPETGYAVGHDGVVLKSIDGGEQWSLVMDGRQQNDVENPYLDVWFDSAEEGYVVGAFGKILHTQDGGKTWVNKQDSVDNPSSMHIYNIERIAGQLYLVGEQGLFNRFNAQTQHFDKLELPYKGSLFGLVGDQQSIWAYGLRGNLFRSADQGKNWQAIPTQVPSALTASAVSPEGRIAIVSLSGQLISISPSHGPGTESSSNSEPQVSLIKLNQPAAAVLALSEGYVIGGLRGLTSSVFTAEQGK